MVDTQPNGCRYMVASAVAPSRRSALFIVLIFLLSTQLVLFQAPEPLDDVESSLHVMGVRNSQGSVDVPEWAVGDVWTFDSFFDVQDLIASGAPGSNVGILRGTLTKEVVDIAVRTDLVMFPEAILVLPSSHSF